MLKNPSSEQVAAAIAAYGQIANTWYHHVYTDNRGSGVTSPFMSMEDFNVSESQTLSVLNKMKNSVPDGVVYSVTKLPSSIFPTSRIQDLSELDAIELKEVHSFIPNRGLGMPIYTQMEIMYDVVADMHQSVSVPLSLKASYVTLVEKDPYYILSIYEMNVLPYTSNLSAGRAVQSSRCVKVHSDDIRATWICRYASNPVFKHGNLSVYNISDPKAGNTKMPNFVLSPDEFFESIINDIVTNNDIVADNHAMVILANSYPAA